jgi:large subunit ribosomal protein L35
MPKLKTRKAASKRYKITGSDKFYVVTLIKVTFNEKSNRKRKLSQKICVNDRDTKSIKLMLPYL